MQYRKATEQDLEQIVTLVQETIKTIYPKYYPKEVVGFFCEHHCRENIMNDVKEGVVGVLLVDGEIVGTGCYRDNHITRVYVNPACQKQGYGSYIMQCLEEEIGLHSDTVCLDASLPASHLYEKRGYKTIKHERHNVANGVVLVYEIMEKRLAGCAVQVADDLFRRKFHCSQAVLAAFSAELGLTEEQALKLGACFGSGMRKGEVCGACSGALMALGLKYGQANEQDLESRYKTNEVTDKFLSEFKKENGSYMCKELLGCDLSTEAGVAEAREKNLFTEFCPKMVESATRIAEALLKQ